MTSIYLKPNKNVNLEKITTYLKKYFKNSKFVKILKTNTQIGSGNILNTNYCEISVCQTRLKERVVIFSAIDNLVKGASGQAIQNMNLIFNYPEKLGLYD